MRLFFDHALFGLFNRRTRQAIYIAELDFGEPSFAVDAEPAEESMLSATFSAFGSHSIG